MGQWFGDGGCGLELVSLAQSGNQVVLRGAGPDVPLSVNGNEAVGQGATLFGKPGHSVRLKLSGSMMQMEGSNNSGGSCVSTFNR